MEERAVPRDWLSRWTAAGGRLYAGRMVALKGDPIWTRISRFGVPWPPYDFGSGMGVEDVLREEAEALGVLRPGQEVPPTSAEDFNARAEAELAGLGPELRDALKSLFGPQIHVDGDRVRWNVAASSYESEYHDLRQMARSVFARSESILGGLGRRVLLPEVDRGAAAAIGEREIREAAVQIAAVATGRKPLYHEHYGLSQAAAEQVARELQRGLPPRVLARADHGHLFVYHPRAPIMATALPPPTDGLLLPAQNPMLGRRPCFTMVFSSSQTAMPSRELSES